EERYQELCDNVLNGLAYCEMIFKDGRPDDFIHLSVNKAFERLTGLKNVVGRKASDVIPGIKESDPELLEIFGRVVRTGTSEKCEIYLEALGQWFDLSVYSGTVNHFGIVVENITPRKQTEEALRTVHGRLSSVMESAGDVIAMIDSKYRYILFNTAFHREIKRIFNRDVKPGDSMLEMLAHLPHDLDNSLKYWARALKGEDFLVEQQFGDQKLERNWYEFHFSPIFNSESKVTSAVHIVRNITVRIKIEMQLKKSEIKYRQLIDNAGDAILIHDHEGRMLAVNQAACSQLGYTYEELMSLAVAKIDTPEETSYAPERIARAMEQGHHFFQTVHQKKDGTPVPTEVRAQIIDWEGCPAMMSICRDITERKQAEEESKKMQAQLFHTSKLASIGTLVAGVAHEINNPLTIIRGHASLLVRFWEKRGVDQSEISLLHKVVIAVDRISSIVNRLRVLARPNNDTHEILSLQTAVQECLSLSGDIYKNDGVQIETIFSGDRPTINGNSGKIQQVILNLLSNAHDAIKKVRSSGVIKISTYIEGEMVVLKIQDNGGGISPTNISHVFDPFFTTKDPGKGTGLGLSISLAIIVAMGGNISVIGEEGVGATFIITLPLVHADDVPPTPCEEIAETPTIKLQGKALVVDDEIDIQDILESYLQGMGLEVATACNGVEALNKLKNETYEYVITDINMPQMDGITLIREAKKLSHLTKTKYLIVTGVLSSTSEQGESYLADGCIHKPFTQDIIVKTLAILSSNLSSKKISSPDDFQPSP
ncbi:MAG: PAS domain S-box protein, partial [Pseudomonadota bacterium]